ncbi:bifunctional homocysteine S-methyltransferase/methylenetetrahydrofolate reductase [Thermoactinomyces sp. DSM 45892]|uniref:bifunctional homocysteine S-methyltransferase/methylenetetrahydrofolate reductase n=1 Tax=Thermoactinomyces sp. DSM 45892 TaxID=1882753 RepID=UPI000896D957|nr:bifunctional homocysteine S-methyltransferase/methylenetetrahydrofolate reductase [Thermoactinomyces sp. DSM 45892]SDY76842.1 homocysteine S-methyltransferase [Thermoactinomyces sp. DSM 45892]
MKGIGILEYLKNHLVVGDGAIATYLYQQGAPVGTCYELYNLTHPKMIADVHQAYEQAGSKLITTNTYGANRERLERYGYGHKVTRINREAVKIARESIQSDTYIAGSIGSIVAGRVTQYDSDEYHDLYEEQATALLHAGVDIILLETFMDLQELLIAINAIRPLTDTPIVAQLSLLEVSRTRDGHSLTDAFAQLQKHGAAGVGLNCRMGPLEIIRALEKTIVPQDLLISAFPNAGRLGESDGELRYKSAPSYFGETAQLLINQGVSIIGGCCGTTPAHIQEIVQIAQSKTPITRINPPVVPEACEILSQPPKRTESTVLEKVAQKRTIICEFDPPKDLDVQSFLLGSQELYKSGVDAITLADNSLASARMSNLALGALLKSQLGIEPLIHVSCRDRNLLGQQSHLMGLHALGIDQILVITGDPTRIGDLPGASSVYDVTSFELISMIKQMNQGLAFTGRPLKQQAQFIVGSAFNPHVRQIESAVARLEKKIQAGADYAMTQPIYDKQTIIKLYEATRHLDIPIFVGIMPITGYRNALFLHNEVPGIKIADDVIRRFESISDPAVARQIGVEIAKDLLDTAMTYFPGIYLITPFSYWPMTVELTRYIREKDARAAQDSA